MKQIRLKGRVVSVGDCWGCPVVNVENIDEDGNEISVCGFNLKLIVDDDIRNGACPKDCPLEEKGMGERMSKSEELEWESRQIKKIKDSRLVTEAPTHELLEELLRREGVNREQIPKVVK